jgi:hypothetical protein
VPAHLDQIRIFKKNIPKDIAFKKKEGFPHICIRENE